MKNNKRILVAALIACIGFGGSYAYAEEADQAPAEPVQAAEAEAKPEVKTINYGVNISFKKIGPYKYENVEGAVITLTNKETKQVFTYTTDGTGAHQHIPYGTYTMHLVSVPDEYKDRFEWPADQEFEARGWSGYRGFNVDEKAKPEPQPEPQPQPQPEPKPEPKPQPRPSDDYNYDFYLPSEDEEKEDKKEESKDARSDAELIANIEETDKEIKDVLDKNEEKKKEENKEKENKEEDKKPEKEEANPEKGKKDKKAAPAKNSNPKTGVASLGYLGGLAAISLAGLVGTKKRK